MATKISGTARQERNDKLKLERSLSHKTLRLLNRETNVRFTRLAATGSFGQFKHSRELTGLFNSHYEKVVAVFLGQQEPFSYAVRAMAVYNNIRIPKQLGLTIEGYDEILEDAHRRSIELHPNNKSKQIAVAKRKVKSLLPFRSSLIANMQTNGVANDSKLALGGQKSSGDLVQAETFGLLLERGDIGETGLEGKKTWSTFLDGNQRKAHGAANGQTVGVGDLFVVGGERLNVPADTNNGASMSNVVNCRCSLIIEVE